jgi:hypothetical protein
MMDLDPRSLDPLYDQQSRQNLFLNLQKLD